MTLMPPSPLERPIIYPDSDGKRMAENTKQAYWIVLLFTNLKALFKDALDVFLAADLLWYPVEGQPAINVAPDVLVVFGRPKGHRGSYKQWEEDHVPLTVVFEILLPGNSHEEMVEKHTFYEEYGVEEYYIYNPDLNFLTVYHRQGTALRRVRPVNHLTSPRLGICFDLSGDELIVRYPDGRAFEQLEEVQEERAREAQKRLDAERERDRERQQRLDTERERDRERQQRLDVERERDRERQQQLEMGRRATRMAELVRKSRLGQITPEELAELERLEQQVIDNPAGA